MEQVDREIVKGLKDGDQRAYGVLIRLYFQSLTLYAKSILNDFEQSRDIVQETFLKLWNNRETLRIDVSLKSYLYRVVHNSCIDFLRKLKTEGNLNAVSYDDLQFRLKVFEIEDNSSFFDFLFSDEYEQALQKEIEKLPEQCREIFLLSRFGQLTYAEIAQKLSLSVSTVKTQMSRAVHKLKSELEKYL